MLDKLCELCHHLCFPCIGAVISSKSQSDQELEESRAEARKIIHALHKAQDKMDHLEVGGLAHTYITNPSYISHPQGIGKEGGGKE